MEIKTKEVIRSSNTNFKINKIINNGNVLIIKKQKSPNTSELVSLINSNTDTSTLGSAYTPKLREPTLVFSGIPIDTDLQNLVSTVTRKNEALKGLDKEFTFLFTIKKGNHNNNNTQPQGSQRPASSDLVFRVSPKVYQIIKDQLNFRIYLDTEGFNVQDRVFVKQCQNCYKYGHKTVECRNVQICRSCGKEKKEGHACEGHRCCTNCGKSERYKLDADHFPNTIHCPFYQSQMQRLRDQTQYTQHTDILSPSLL